jgi:hypothetical protein
VFTHTGETPSLVTIDSIARPAGGGAAHALLRMIDFAIG